MKISKIQNVYNTPSFQEKKHISKPTVSNVNNTYKAPVRYELFLSGGYDVFNALDDSKSIYIEAAKIRQSIEDYTKKLVPSNLSNNSFSAKNKSFFIKNDTGTYFVQTSKKNASDCIIFNSYTKKKGILLLSTESNKRNCSIYIKNFNESPNSFSADNILVHNLEDEESVYLVRGYNSIIKDGVEHKNARGIYRFSENRLQEIEKGSAEYENCLKKYTPSSKSYALLFDKNQ